MKTKIIPFDLETVKKIQAKEIKGKVYFIAKLADGSKIYTFNLKAIHSINNLECPYYGVFECNGEDCIQYIKSNGYIPEQLVPLIIEVPDNEPQFKPFDKVLVRDLPTNRWFINLFSHCGRRGNKITYNCMYGDDWIYCIPYEGNEHLVGTTDEPEED